MIARESHNLPSGHLLIFQLKGTTSLLQFLPLKVFEGAGVGGRGMGSYCSVGTVSIWDEEKVLEMNSGDSCTNCAGI